MKQQPAILIGAIILSLILGMIGGWISHSANAEDTAYVNGAMLFSEFSMTKELNVTLSNTQQTRKSLLDSLELRVRQLGILQQANPSDRAISDSLRIMAEELRYKSEKFSSDNQAQLETYQEQIWKQLNQYVGEYRSEQGYAYLFGANGSGTLMAAAPELDVTEEVIAFVNLRYEGN